MTVVKEFILLAFPNLHHFRLLLFVLVLLMYSTCVFGNITIIFLVTWYTSLHTPMYLFISTFAILEIIFVSVMVPKFLHILISGKHKISFVGCFTQQFLGNTMGIVECYLLAVMAFDRDLAINSPFNYISIMSKLKTKLTLCPWIVGFAFAAILTIFTARLKFCGRNKLDHFFCDLTPLQNLACSGTFVSRAVTNSVAIIAVLFPFIMIIGLYLHIIVTVSKIKSADGKHKAFSTCSSHLIVASLFFGTAIIVYVRPNGTQYDKFLALIYTIVTPLFNPFIYTLRNRDVKTVLFKTFDKLNFMQKTLRNKS
ncbi:olfactory receptor 1468-like [Pseudophryne corroboree]|uniref:olfactory receptor 1468-like n=1 Tax=Pseudophryne corroboree TaxID=495146 RepID=UPI003081DCDF